MPFSRRQIPLYVKQRISSFTYLNVTQFLGALNDNVFKLLTVFFLISIEGIAKTPQILFATGTTFVLPFLLFSTFSGSLADRYSKRNIIVYTKIFELLIMIAGLIVFVFESPLGCYLVLFLMAMQSALFGPSKYGIVPELVESDRILNANGLLSSFTYLAIILGTFFASFLLDITQRNFLFAASFCILLSLIGMITSFKIPYTLPSGSKRKLEANMLVETWRALLVARQDPVLLTAIFGTAFFIFLSSYAQLNMIPYAVSALGLTDIYGGYLFLIAAIGIGAGSLIFGFLPGKSIELGLVPLAGIGITVSCYLIDFLSPHLPLCLPMVLLMGLFGGIYQVPLDTYVQIASPDRQRGQILAASYFLSFIGVLLSSFLIYINTEVFGFEAKKGFTSMACITLIVSIVFGFQYFDFLCRFIGLILSRLHFSIKLIAEECIPSGPALYVCRHTAWNDTLLMLGVQGQRMRFFVEQPREHIDWWHQFYRLLRIIQIPSIIPLENNKEWLASVRTILDSGCSVCILIDQIDVLRAIDKLNNSYQLKELLGDTFPVVPVFLDKGSKSGESLFFKKLYQKLRVPTSIGFGAEACKTQIEATSKEFFPRKTVGKLSFVKDKLIES